MAAAEITARIATTSDRRRHIAERPIVGSMFSLSCRSSKSDMPQYPWLSAHRQHSLLEISKNH
jgi:hypothetical protein